MVLVSGRIGSQETSQQSADDDVCFVGFD